MAAAAPLSAQLANRARALRDNLVQDSEGKPLIVRMFHGKDSKSELVREGEFQTWLSLIAGLSAALSGLEVGYEHWRGSYSRRVMYTPVLMSVVLAGVGVAGFRSRRMAKMPLRIVSAVTLADCVIGFYFHIRGVARKPGGWRIPVINMIMGPPIFAPLLFGIAGYLGFVASQFRDPGTKPSLALPKPGGPGHWFAPISGHHGISKAQDERERRFQRHFAIATMVSAFFSGFEALYSHYKNNFKYWVQWTPIAITPALMLAAGAAIKNKRLANTALPVVSAAAMLDGGVGFFYHARGVIRRPGAKQKPIYSIIYGPPIFAPLLFAASGFLGIIASFLRRQK